MEVLVIGEFTKPKLPVGFDYTDDYVIKPFMEVVEARSIQDAVDSLKMWLEDCIKVTGYAIDDQVEFVTNRWTPIAEEIPEYKPDGIGATIVIPTDG